MKNITNNNTNTPSMFNPFNNNHPMRNLFVLFAFILVASMFTSCEQDDLFADELTDSTTLTENTSTATDNETLAPEKTDFGFSGKEEMFKEELSLRRTEFTPEVTFDAEAAAENVDTRNDYELYISSPPSQINLTCGQVVHSSLYPKVNSISNNFYNHFGFSANLNGNDEIYSFYSSTNQEVSFRVTNTNQNLAMFLFEGHYSAPYAYVKTIKAHSTSQSNHSEALNNVHLQAGKHYVLIIDSKPGYPSNFRLAVECHNNVRYCDNFNGRTTGVGIAAQVPAKWSKWSHSSQDLPVRPNKYLKVERNNFGSSQPDVILKTGTLTHGRYKLDMDMWVYGGESAYFNIQKRLRTEWGAEIHFNSNGTGEVEVGGQSYYFYYPQNVWFNCELIFNFNTNRVGLYINGAQATNSWRLSATHSSYYGSSMIEGIDFYAPSNNTRYFIDNVCFDNY